MKRVLLGMSGGVDSTTAALLLKQKGYEVVGISFIFNDLFDSKDVTEVCKKLDIELHILDYKKEFKENVINYFLSEYEKGYTPNPCVICNKLCKFKYLFDNMEKFNCDYIATGHYAKIIDGKLYKSNDLNKDQTYFLSQLTKEQLNKTIFPLDGLSKEEVKKIADENSLIPKEKKESYDVCFIDTSFKEYILKNIKQNPGDIIDITTNKIIGKHEGLSKYTIGQRRGLNVGGTENRLFVVGKDTKNNILYVSEKDENEYLLSDSCIIDNVSFNIYEKIYKCNAKFRYKSIECPVELEYLDNNQVLVKYDKMKSVTPGQACVFYIGNECIGGGTIKVVNRDNEKLWYIL